MVTRPRPPIAAVALLVAGLACSTAGARGVDAPTFAAPDTLVDVSGRTLAAGDDPIPGVHVFIEGTTTGTVSDAAGRFRLRVAAGRQTLVCSAVGFVKTRLEFVAAPGMPEVACVLEAAVLEAGEVVVIAARRPQLAREVPASLEVLPAETLGSRNVVALDEALQNVAGVQIQGNQVNIRGTSGFAYNTGSRVLLLVDGAPMMGPDADGVPLDALPLTQIHQVEVLKGPGSALYGTGALGGVINVVTRNVPESAELAFRTYAGGYQPTRHDAWRQRWSAADAWRPFGGLAASVAGKLSDRFGGWVSVDARTDSGFRRLSAFRQLQLFGKAEYAAGESVDIDVLAGVLLRKRDSFLFWNGLDDALNPGSIQLSRSTTPSGSNDNFTNQVMIQPRLLKRYRSSVLSTRLRTYATFIRPIDDDGNARPLSDGTVGARIGGEVQWQHYAGGTSQLIVGAAADANATRSSFFVTDDGDRVGAQPEVGVFAQWESRLHPAVATVAGLRFDWFRISSDETASRLSPKLSVGFTVHPRLVLRASGGLGFRVPSLAERYTDDQSFFPVFRNPTLRPERSASVEVGARGWSGAGRRRVEWDFAAFRYGLRDLIEPRFVRTERDGRTPLGFQFVNLSRGRVSGVEARAEATPLPRIRVRAGYTFLSSEDEDTGAALPFRPRHLVVGGADYDAGLLSAGLDVRYASRPEVVDSDFGRFVPDADLLAETRVVDATVGIRLGPVDARILIKNVLNYYYLERPALLAAPRSVTVQLTGRL